MYPNQQRPPPHEDMLAKAFTEYIGCHPTYMIPLVRAHQFLLRDLGPVNYATRYYIAILASARHHSTYMINYLRKEFLANGGNQEWLKGIEFAPQKLRALNQINKILAHQPWLLNISHIEELIKGQSSWTLSELTHAILIMAHFHSLCTLTFGCKFGISEPEIFEDNDVDYVEVEIEELRFDPNGSQKIKKVVKRSPASKLIIERCRQLEIEETNLVNIVNSITLNGKKRRNFNRARPNRETDTVSLAGISSASSSPPDETSSLIDDNRPLSETSQTSGSAPNLVRNNSTEIVQFVENTWSEDEWKKNNYQVFVENPEFSYLDFARKDRPAEITTFRIQDYQWDDQGYALANYLYPEVGNLFDEKFKVGYNLTYFTLGPKTNVDTSPFRRAIWNYIQSIYGVRHDDYNYREVNILLERNLKSYIKCLSCFPEAVVQKDYSNVMKGFRASEKIHVIVMVSEARLQAEVLYVLRTLMEYIKLEA